MAHRHEALDLEDRPKDDRDDQNHREAGIQRAKTIPGVEMLLLTVAVDQPAPRKLYASLGFRSFGVEPRGLKIGNDSHDEENMVLEFHR